LKKGKKSQVEQKKSRVVERKQKLDCFGFEWLRGWQYLQGVQTGVGPLRSVQPFIFLVNVAQAPACSPTSRLKVAGAWLLALLEEKSFLLAPSRHQEWLPNASPR
jgi:hypothetical protein